MLARMPSKFAIACCAAVLGAAVDARGDDAPPPPPRYSPGLSLGLSIGTTVAGWGLFAGGIALDDDGAGAISLMIGGQAVAAFGPSAGHVYVGEYRHALIASSVRAAALALIDVGILAASSCAIGGGSGDGSDDQSDCGNGGTAAVFIGLGVAAGLGLYDWVDAPRAARRASRRAATLQLAVVPLRVPNHQAVGLGLAGTF